MADSNEGSKPAESAPHASPETLQPTPAEDRPHGKAAKLSDEAQGFLNEANGASDPASNAWLAFLALLTYLLVTLAGVSHKDLLLNSAVKLPIIANVEIPIVSFFQYAPALLLLVYLSLLIQHAILARKYSKFTEAVAPYEWATRTEHPARELVHSYVGAQILAGPRPNRITNLLMRLIVYVTFTILPVITLLYFQIKFLPYHEVWITYWHRVAVILGILMLFLVAPIIQHSLRAHEWDRRDEPQTEAWRASRKQTLLGAVVFSLIIGFSWLIATVPDEWIDRRLGFVPPASVRPGDEATLLNPIVRFTYERIPDATRGLRGLLAYRVLVVEDTDLSAGDAASVVLRERDLRFALLSRSDLHRADLTWADLRGAQMWKTRVDKGKLRDTQLQGAFLREAQLRGANLSSAKLQGADLSSAQLQGVDLSYAQLQGADLSGAELQGADLSHAGLQGADLTSARLDGANLNEAELEGADLSSAEIWLVDFPPGLADQRPPPRGLADVKISPRAAETKVKLKQDLAASITDPVELSVLMSHLDPVLRDDPPSFDAGAAAWTDYANKANVREPSAAETVRFLARLACDDGEGYVANRLAQRLVDQAGQASATTGPGSYAKPLASALLEENCPGGHALGAERRAALERLSLEPQ